MYNLLKVLQDEGARDYRNVINSYKDRLRNAHLKSFHSGRKKRQREDDGAGRESGGGGFAGGAGGGASDSEQFRAHGYKLQPEPEVIVDKWGCVWEPLFQVRRFLFLLFEYQAHPWSCSSLKIYG